jgi:predicted transcriptional regulator
MELVRNYVLLKGNYFFITVDDHDNAINRVALTDIMKVRKKLWNSKTLESIGTPIEKIDYASIEQSAADILERMLDMDVTQTPVVKENKMIGLIDTDELLHLAALRRDLRFLTDSRQ